MNNIILVAPPAAGKGTQAKLIQDELHIPHISTGDLLRNIDETTELGKEIKDRLKQGLLISDEIVIELLKERISKEDCNNGYILDGFPRTVSQANSYVELLKSMNREIGKVIFLDIDYDTACKRITGRISCPKCGTVYNEYIIENKPKNDGICDNCNSNLTKREDDNEETFKVRFNTYREQTEPLINYFKDLNILYSIDSTLKVEEIFNQILEVINDQK